MTAKPYLFVLAGGSGTRFWPKSTSMRPKQLLSFSKSGKTLIEETLARFDGWISPTNRFILTTEKLRQPIEKLLSSDVQILAEPAGRNTAPCLYWAARVVAEKSKDAVMVVMPSDHFIADEKSFQSTLKKAVEFVSNKKVLGTIGVKPTRPETGYGYLKVDADGSEVLTVEKFIEKPNEEKANEFFKSGQYLWNGGMFVWRVDVLLEAFDEYMPEMKKAWESSSGKVEEAYPKMTATSIDFGVMEKANNVVSFPIDCGWDDLGSWLSLDTVAVNGDDSRGTVVDMDASGNIVDAPGKLVALLGVSDLIVVHSGDSVLVAKKERSQDIRKLVDRVREVRPDLV